jgi:hypothetical protein
VDLGLGDCDLTVVARTLEQREESLDPE